MKVNKINWQKIIVETGLSDNEIAEEVGLHFTRIWRLRTACGCTMMYENGVAMLDLHKRETAEKLRKKHKSI